MIKEKIINIAVIAHVDAGKSTLVDALLEQTGTFNERDEKVEQIMDSNDQEKERGITIYSKNASVNYKGVKINIVDTPGHADFSGEVERIIKTVDTVILLVDCVEGPMPQTRFVLSKALENNLKPILLINKIDKPGSRIDEVIDSTLELFLELNASDEQIEFPILYGITKDGIVKKDLNKEKSDVFDLFDLVIDHVEDYPFNGNENLQLQISSLNYDNYLGRMGSGRVTKGTIKKGDRLSLITNNGQTKTSQVAKLFVMEGLIKKEVKEASAGEIVIVSGISDITIGDTLSSLENPEPMEPIKMEEPTISMNFYVNDSPLAGLEGKNVTSRNIKERLLKEIETNVALRVNDIKDEDGYEVQGRGELHLSVLIESMRREGFELAVSKPKVLFKEVDGLKLEPYEEATVTCDDEYSGSVINQLQERKGMMIDMGVHNNQTRMVFKIPTRGLIGYRQTFITTTRGTGILEKFFLEYDVYAGEIKGRKNGALVSTEKGQAVAYALWKLGERGQLIIKPQDKVYEGMVVGINSKYQDLNVNPVKGKQLTNVRASGHDDAIRVPIPVKMSLEESLEFIEHDELLEVTPQTLRVRKKILDKRFRKVTR
ncbi:MAG: translational GTPase TypA, partial [Mollicutes bacterium PWAP]|nr:translational GTPase TypA [Mollicutes bacterium PWAP]